MRLERYYFLCEGGQLVANDIILYNTEDGQTKIELHLLNGTVWLSQLEIAELFQTTKNNISLHVKKIFEDQEQESDCEFH